MFAALREDTRRADDGRLLRGGQRHLDDLDAEVRGVGVVLRAAPRAAGQLRARPHRAGAGHVDVDVGGVARVGHQRVRVRAAAGLHRRYLARLVEVGDVEDAHAAEALGAHGVVHALPAAVHPPARLLHRHEQQVAVDGHVALPAGARVRSRAASARAGPTRPTPGSRGSRPGRRRLPRNARSASTKPKSPRLASLNHPAGRSWCPTSSRLRAAWPASFHPARRPTRGSAAVPCARAAAGAASTAAASSRAAPRRGRRTFRWDLIAGRG